MTAPAALPPFWPHRATSRRVRAAGHDWHVQAMGQGPDLLLLHGAGGAGMSFRALMPLLAPHYRCLVPDLTGQGYTRAGRRGRTGLRALTDDLAALALAEGWQPCAIIGHSAGAALALTLVDRLHPRAVVGINAALGTFEGVQGLLYPVLARALALTPFVPHLFSRLTGTEDKVKSLLASTGSPLDAEGQRLYRHLVARTDHVDGTLSMMADWPLEPLLRHLPQIQTPCLLIASGGDRAVPARVSARAAARLPAGEYAEIPGYGHLVHEEAPAAVMDLLTPFLARHCPQAAG